MSGIAPGGHPARRRCSPGGPVEGSRPASTAPAALGHRYRQLPASRLLPPLAARAGRPGHRCALAAVLAAGTAAGRGPGALHQQERPFSGVCASMLDGGPAAAAARAPVPRFTSPGSQARGRRSLTVHQSSRRTQPEFGQGAPTAEPLFPGLHGSLSGRGEARGPRRSVLCRSAARQGPGWLCRLREGLAQPILEADVHPARCAA